MNSLAITHALPQALSPLKFPVILGLLAMSVLHLHANEGAGQKITIDGDVDDWKPIPPVVDSAQSPATEHKKEVDVSQLKVGNDDENLYLYLAATAPPLTAIEGSKGGIAQGVFVVYLDTDGDITTGCKDLDLLGANGRKVSGFDLQIVVSVGRNAGSLGALGAKDGPFAKYETFAPRNGSFVFRDRKRLNEKYSIYRKTLVALCPMGIELALPLDTYQIKPGLKIRLLMHKMGSMENAVYSEGSYQITPAQ